MFLRQIPRSDIYKQEKRKQTLNSSNNLRLVVAAEVLVKIALEFPAILRNILRPDFDAIIS